MKKILVVSAIVILAVTALGAVGFAYAQTQTPPDFPYGGGMMRRGGGMGGGMMGRWGGGSYGPMHQYMVDTFAEALGMTSADLQAKLDAGETMYSVAQAQGLSDDEFTTLMVDARTKAMELAVADGVVTQEQADWMSQRMEQRQEAGFGPGNCPMHSGGFGPGGGQGWQNQP